MLLPPNPPLPNYIILDFIIIIFLYNKLYIYNNNNPASNLADLIIILILYVANYILYINRYRYIDR